MEKKKKCPVETDNLEVVSGGKNETTTTTYNRETQGNRNVVVTGTGDQLLNRFDELLNKGIFDNLKKQGES